jgi:hypothetical protein
MIIPNQEEMIMGRTEKSTTIITSVDTDTNHPDFDFLLTTEAQNRLLYGITLLLLVVSLMNIYAW